MAQGVDVYTWRNAIMSDLGPANPIARLVLMTISLHMKADGTGAWPSQQTIAKRSKVGLRSVKRHLEIADRHDWIGRLPRKRAGQQWRMTEYVAIVPDAVFAKLPERPWESDPKFNERGKGGATVAPRPPEKADEVPEATERGATGDRRGARECRNVVPQWPTNSSSNSSGNSPSEGAFGTALEETREERKAEIARLKAISKTPRRPSIQDAAWLRKTLGLGMDVERIAKVSASSPEEVRRAIADLNRHPDPEKSSTDPALQS